MSVPRSSRRSVYVLVAEVVHVPGCGACGTCAGCARQLPDVEVLGAFSSSEDAAQGARAAIHEFVADDATIRGMIAGIYGIASEGSGLVAAHRHVMRAVAITTRGSGPAQVWATSLAGICRVTVYVRKTKMRKPRELLVASTPNPS